MNALPSASLTFGQLARRCAILVLLGYFGALSSSHAVEPPVDALKDIDPASDREVQPFGDTPVTGYRLTWSDEFNSDEIYYNKWYPRVGAKLWSAMLPANNSVADGLFRIHLKKEKAQGKEYTGGGIISKKLFRYGYYETRMKAPEGEGWHSSFWMMRDMELRTVPQDGVHIELDVIETDSSDPYHYQTDAHRWRPDPHRKFGTKQIITTVPLTDFHVYGLEFTPTELRYFMDGKLVSATDASQFPHTDVNIWLSCLAGKLGPKTEKVDDTKLPQETQYDYVRFFEKAPNATASVAVSVDAPGTATLRHGANGYTGLNSFIQAAKPDDTFGEDDEMMVGKAGGKPVRALLSFPLAELDDDAVVEKAELTVWCYYDGNQVGEVKIHELDGTFVPGTGDGFRNPGTGTGATWTTRNVDESWKTSGGDFQAEVLSSLEGFKSEAFAAKTFPSTEKLVASVQKALKANTSLNLILISEDLLGRFVSNRGILEYRPVLTLTYREKPSDLKVSAGE